METKRRSWCKAMTWQALGLVTSLGVSFWHTASLSESIGLTLSLAATGLVMYAVHERLWDRIHWGRQIEP